jgi:hypothetical protein
MQIPVCLDVSRQHGLQHAGRLAREMGGQEVQAKLHPAELGRWHDVLGKPLRPQVLRQAPEPGRQVPHRASLRAAAVTIESSRFSATTSMPPTRPSSSAVRSPT